MVTILHGENLVESKNKLDELKEKASEIINLSGDKISLTDLNQALESQSLFYEDRLVIIENLLSTKPSKSKDQLINYLSEGQYTHSVILWEGKEVSSTVLKKFPKANTYNFKPSSNIFKLVDSLKPQRGKELTIIFHDLLKTEVPEIIFVMLVRQFRNLILAKNGSSDFLKKFAPWQKAKLESQSKYFTESQLLSYHRKLLDIDVKIKLGQSPYNIIQLLDIFLINF